MLSKFEQFIQEKRYLQNVSPRTEDWHRQSLKWLGVEGPTQDDLKNFVMRMRDRGLKPTTCNCRIRSVNCYLKWTGSALKIAKVKEDVRILPTFSVQDIAKFVTWHPRGFAQNRLQAVILFLCDTGSRISEALGVKWSEVDFDNLLVTLHGKGGRDRIIPISFQLRRVLWRFKERFGQWDLTFCTTRGMLLERQNVMKSVKKLCARLKIKTPPRTLHAFRHTFALEYLRRGGNAFLLQKQLGHSSLEMTKRYVHLQTADLQAVHEQVSLLAR